MKAGHNKKSVRVEFVMSEQEAELIVVNPIIWTLYNCL